MITCNDCVILMQTEYGAMYIFIRSNDSNTTHPGNTSTEFISELPRPVVLEDELNCALVECDIGDKTGESFIIYCDLVENSCVHGQLIPILNIITKSGSVNFPYYIPVSKNAISRIRIRLLNKEGETPTSIPSYCRLVLHFKKST